MIVLYIPYDTLQLLSMFVYVSFKRLELLVLLTLGVIVVGRSEVRSVAPLPNDFVVPVHLEVGQELRLCFLDQLLLALLEQELFFSRQGFPCRRDDIAGRNFKAIL
jgi:hypothetical protein